MKRKMNPQRHDGRDYLSTAQVAARLGVKPETVYAYVSRGLLVSTRIPMVRGSLFAVDEVEQLASREGARRTAGGSVEHIRSQLTLLAEDELYFRGKKATELVDLGFERVAEFLWTGDLPDQVDWPESAPIHLNLPPTARLVDRMKLSVDYAAAADPFRADLTERSLVNTARGIISAAMPGTGHIAERLWMAIAPKKPTDDQLHLLDSALVLLADHDLAASTLAARVAASARANLYAVVGAGLSAMDGTLHGAMPERAAALLDGDPRVSLGNALRDGRVPGFGHPIYQHRDPRAAYLLGALNRVAPGPYVDAANLVVHEVEERLGTFPTSRFCPRNDDQNLGSGFRCWRGDLRARPNGRVDCSRYRGVSRDSAAVPGARCLRGDPAARGQEPDSDLSRSPVRRMSKPA